MMIPTLPANAVVTLTFQNQPTGNNTPLTKTEMLGPAYNFDATIQITKPAAITGTSSTDLAKWKSITNGSLAVSVDGKTYQATGLNFSGLANMNYMFGSLSGGVKGFGFPFKAYYIGGQGIVFGGKSMALQPATTGTDIGPMLLGNPTTSSASEPMIASARKMMEAGVCKPWAQGPIAQTMICADDSASHQFDLDSLRPRFYVTFWPATKQVAVRYVGEISNTENLKALYYDLSLKLGGNNPQEVYSQKNITHSVATRWTRTAWINGAPEQKINIDYNVGYLAATYAISNYDASVTVPNANIGYSEWLKADRSIGGAGWWDISMPDPGDRQDISPMPGVTTKWLYESSWQAREEALGQADLAGAWPMQYREGRTDKFADRDRKVPGFGRPMTKYGRPTLGADHPSAADALTIQAPSFEGGDLWQNNRWTPDAAHRPDPFFPPYLVTGDYFYLESLQLWAGQDTFCWAGNGPSNCYGDIARIRGQIRGNGWQLRDRLNAWLASPDDDPMKSVYVDAIHDALASWEGQFDIKGTQYEGTPAWNFTHRFIGTPDDGWQGKGVAPLGWAEMGGYSQELKGTINPAITNSAGALWMHGYFTWAISRAVELGFPAKPMQKRLCNLFIGPLTTPGYPAHLLGQYVIPDTKIAPSSPKGWDHFTSWADVLTGWQPALINDPTKPVAYWPSSRTYLVTSRMGVASCANLPGGAQAWSAMQKFFADKTTITGRSTDWGSDPSFNIMPRASTP